MARKGKVSKLSWRTTGGNEFGKKERIMRGEGGDPKKRKGNLKGGRKVHENRTTDGMSKREVPLLGEEGGTF